jgi:hypothetical protein
LRERDTPNDLSGYQGTEPRFSPQINQWCIAPEWGLSAFPFKDEKTLQQALWDWSDYLGDNINMAVFESENYRLNIHDGGEAQFQGGRFLGYIDDLSPLTFDSILKSELSVDPPDPGGFLSY